MAKKLVFQINALSISYNSSCTCSSGAYFLGSASFAITLASVCSHLELVLSLWFQPTNHHLQQVACVMYRNRVLANGNSAE